VCLAVALVAVGTWLVIRERSLQQVDRSLQATADAVVDDLRRPGIGQSDFLEAPAPVGGGAQGDAPSGPDVDVTFGRQPPSGPRTVTLDGESYRFVVRALPTSDPDAAAPTVAIYRPLEDVQATIRIAGWALGTTALLAGVLAIGLVLVIVRRALRPLAQAHSAAEQVAESEDLSIRIPVRRDDEVGRLASAMNTMLERLQGARARLTENLDRQRRFAADASHELRTPLTTLRGDIDLLLAHDLPEEERRVVLDEMSASTDRMGRLVEGLLSLARLDSTAEPATQRVDLEALLCELAAPEEGPDVEPEARAIRVLVHPDSARGIFTNLIDNGRRYGGDVRIALGLEDGHALVVVTDAGPGIPEAERDRIFDRFYRGRTVSSTPGAGLGLAIARRAAESAGGSLVAVPAEHGARFEVRLPRAPAEEGPESAPSSADRGAWAAAEGPTGEIRGVSATVAPSGAEALRTTPRAEGRQDDTRAG
jgi:signal transduction histidine kinase